MKGFKALGAILTASIIFCGTVQAQPLAGATRVHSEALEGQFERDSVRSGNKSDKGPGRKEVKEEKEEPEVIFDAYGNALDPANTWGYSSWTGSKLTRKMGINHGPTGIETYYNLNMYGIFKWFGRELLPYTSADMWIRPDGVKMLGPYVMCAGDLNKRSRGSLVNTSLGMGIIVDHCEMSQWTGDGNRIDIAVCW